MPDVVTDVQIHKDDDESGGWVPYVGPDGGEGWQDADNPTDVRYQRDPPGDTVDPFEVLANNGIISDDKVDRADELIEYIGNTYAASPRETDRLKDLVGGVFIEQTNGFTDTLDPSADEFGSAVEYVAEEIVNSEQYDLAENDLRDELDLAESVDEALTSDDVIQVDIGVGPIVEGNFVGVEDGELQVQYDDGIANIDPQNLEDDELEIEYEYGLNDDDPLVNAALNDDDYIDAAFEATPDEANMAIEAQVKDSDSDTKDALAESIMALVGRDALNEWGETLTDSAERNQMAGSSASQQELAEMSTAERIGDVFQNAAVRQSSREAGIDGGSTTGMDMEVLYHSDGSRDFATPVDAYRNTTTGVVTGREQAKRNNLSSPPIINALGGNAAQTAVVTDPDSGDEYIVKEGIDGVEKFNSGIIRSQQFTESAANTMAAGYFVGNGDLHGGNVMVNEDDELVIIDHDSAQGFARSNSLKDIGEFASNGAKQQDVREAVYDMAIDIQEGDIEIPDTVSVYHKEYLDKAVQNAISEAKRVGYEGLPGDAQPQRYDLAEVDLSGQFDSEIADGTQLVVSPDWTPRDITGTVDGAFENVVYLQTEENGLIEIRDEDNVQGVPIVDEIESIFDASLGDEIMLENPDTGKLTEGVIDGLGGADLVVDVDGDEVTVNPDNILGTLFDPAQLESFSELSRNDAVDVFAPDIGARADADIKRIGDGFIVVRPVRGRPGEEWRIDNPANVLDY